MTDELKSRSQMRRVATTHPDNLVMEIESLREGRLAFIEDIRLLKSEIERLWAERDQLKAENERLGKFILIRCCCKFSGKESCENCRIVSGKDR